MNREQETRAITAKKLGAFFRWLIVVLACLWISWCTSIGPLMRNDYGTRDFGWLNALLFLATFAVTLGSVYGLTVLARRREQRTLLGSLGTPAKCPPPSSDSSTVAHSEQLSLENAQKSEPNLKDERKGLGRTQRLGTWIQRFWRSLSSLFSRGVLAATSSWRRIWLVLAIGWLWVPLSLLSAFGADIYSQTREFAWAWNQWTGMEQPYIGFFSFVPMDIYPTAHYLWPDNPTYLTDQHNIVLTFFYGGTAAISRYFTGSNDAGFVLLSLLQWIFAGFCLASAANRFFNMPWVPSSPAHDFRHPERGDARVPVDFANPARGTARVRGCRRAGTVSRALILVLFLFCPLVFFSTISLTKSPLFAFAFTWWFGLMYELYMTQRSDTAVPVRRVTIAGLVVSCAVMLISAKYAWYILLAQVVFSVIADRKRWKVYVLTILLPTVVIHGGISLMISSGAIIGGDPIESRGVQLQMIARVAERNPGAIDEQTRKLLEPIFNLDQTAAAYRGEDADPVKSSGIQSKKVSYKWRSVTPQNVERLNEATARIVKADPHTALDALFAKSYGYFDIFDRAYVPMSYYVNNDYVQANSTWIKYYDHDWRNAIVGFTQGWSKIPVLGWFTHGNFYVVLTLLLGAAEVALKRWRALSWHMSLLLLMGVMLTAPANNFERHMLPIAFVFGFLCLMFARDSGRRCVAKADLGGN